MIFALGVVLIGIGFILVNAFGGPTVFGIKLHNQADYWGGGLTLIGVILSVGSVLNFLARWLA